MLNSTHTHTHTQQCRNLSCVNVESLHSLVSFTTRLTSCMILALLLIGSSSGLNAQVINYGVKWDNNTPAYFVAEVHSANSAFGNECGPANCDAELSNIGPHYDVPDYHEWDFPTFEDQSGNLITNANVSDLVAIQFKEYFGSAGGPTQVHTLAFCPDDLTVSGGQLCSSFSNHYGVIFDFVAYIQTPPNGGNPIISVEINI